MKRWLWGPCENSFQGCRNHGTHLKAKKKKRKLWELSQSKTIDTPALNAFWGLFSFLHSRGEIPESENCWVVSDSLQPHGWYSPWNSPGQNTGVGSLSLLQGIFPAQGSNPSLPYCRQILYQLSHKEVQNARVDIKRLEEDDIRWMLRVWSHRKFTSLCRILILVKFPPGKSTILPHVIKK